MKFVESMISTILAYSHYDGCTCGCVSRDNPFTNKGCNGCPGCGYIPEDHSCGWEDTRFYSGY